MAQAKKRGLSREQVPVCVGPAALLSFMDKQDRL